MKNEGYFRNRIILALLLIVMAFLVMFRSLSFTQRVAYAKMDQVVSCGLPFHFLTVNFDRFDPPFPVTYSCVPFNPWEDPYSFHWVNFFFSFMCTAALLSAVAVACLFTYTYAKSRFK